MCLKVYTLNQFEIDLKSFYEYCKENNLTDEEIRKICEPLSRTIIKGKLMKIAKITTIVLLLLSFLYALSYIETISWHCSAIGRIILIKLLPLYDWRYLKNEKCLIDNPKTISDTVECTYCETLRTVPIDFNLNRERVKEIYLDLNVPVLLADSLENWPVKDDFVDELLSNDLIYYSYPCKLSTNLLKNDGPIGKVLEKLRNTETYFVHFENCDFEVTKALRTFTPRPDYLYIDVSPIQYNWLLFSKNYNVTKYKRIKLNERITIIGQIRGSNYVRLKPIDECYEECEILDLELKNGDSLLFTSMWDVEYKPNPDTEENIAVILEAH